MFFTSVSLLSLQRTVGVPPTKVPINLATFCLYVLPPLICQFLVAVLAVKPQTHTARVALLPLVVLLALRAVFSVNVSFGETDLNIDLVLFLFSVVARTLDWALIKGPLVRHLRPANSSPSTIMDALDLITNYRGLGWNWSHYQLYTPRQTLPTQRITFVCCTFPSAVTHGLVCSVFYKAVLTLAPSGVGPDPRGSTIFDETLPFLVQYLRASIITALTGFAIYTGIQMCYDLLAISAILILRQDPAQWPPAFDAPWRATSLSDFWGRRWHQWLRHSFLSLGGYPLSFVLGRTGVIIGAFLASAVMHHVGMATLNSQLEIQWMLVGFGMMAPGVLAERAFHRLTGRRVGGALGWVWTMAWLLLWGNFIVEGFARAGFFNCVRFFSSALPAQIPVERWVADFNAWLHAL